MVLNDIQAWSDKLIEGRQLGEECFKKFSAHTQRQPSEIVFFGMGGSGIAGAMVKNILDRHSPVRSYVYHSSHIPSWINTESLVFVMSYSGNTWETVAALKALLAKGVFPIVISHGGKALKIAKENGLVSVEMPEAMSPRGSLGYFLGIFLAFFGKAGLVDGNLLLDQFSQHCQRYVSQYSKDAYFQEFIAAVNNKETFQVWGVAGESDVFAYRAQTQFNENSKVQATYLEFPELCHNLIVGFTQVKIEPLVVWYYTDFLDDNMKKAVIATQQILQEKGVALYKPPILGDTFEQQLFNIILWSDFASYFLGLARGVEINPVVLIDKLKQKHKELGIQV